MQNNNNIKKDRNNRKIILILTTILIVFFVVITICTAAYSRYVLSMIRESSAQVGTMICEMEVKSSDPIDTIVNPYCTVIVKDYNNEKVTEIDVEFTIEVVPEDMDFVLPEFAWIDESTGNIIALSTDIKDGDGNIIGRTADFPPQTFESRVAEEKKYKIIFYNTGEEIITEKQVQFNLKAVQKMAE